MSVSVQKWLFRILLAAFCVALVWWTFYLPYDEHAVLRAIPADAAFVSVHDNVPARLGDISGSPLVRCLLFSAGMSFTNGEDAVSDPETIKWVNKLAKRRVAIAYTPSLGGSGREGWFLSSWVGSYGMRLRWMALLGLIPDASPAGMCGRQRIWTAPLSGIRGGRKLSVAVSDGVLMCCISTTSNGVSAMVEAFDGVSRIPQGMTAAGRPPDAAILQGSASPDRGWAACGGEWPQFTFEIETLIGSNSMGRIRTSNILPAGVAPLKSGDFEDLGVLLGDTPEMMGVFSSGQALQLLGLPGAPREAQMVSNIISKCAGGRLDRAMFTCLFGGKYRARLKSIIPGGLGDLIGGIPVPVIMCGIRMDDVNGADQMAAGILDSLNTDYRLGVIARAVPVGEEAVTAIEGTGPGAYSSFAADERVGYAVCGRWLIISSNVEVLSKLVARYQREDAKKDAASARWLNGLRREDAAVAYAWADLEAAGVTIKDSLALWKLSIQFGQSRTATRTLRMISFYMDWTDTIRQLQTGSVAVRTDGAVTELRFAQGL